MAYKVTETSLPDVLVIEPKVFDDSRGYFFESFNKNDFLDATGCNDEFVQDNVSFSHHGVIRGLHFQNPNPQGKLIRVISGAIFDVALDLRKSSNFFGKWTAIELSAENRYQLWVPKGFAHGFQVVSNEAVVAYKTTDFWNFESEQTIAWDDPGLGIDWPIRDNHTINDKDMCGASINNSKVFQ